MNRTAWELAQLPTEPVDFGRPDGATLTLVGVDPRLEAAVVTKGMLTLNGWVADGAWVAILALKVDGNFMSVAFSPGMTKSEMFDEFVRRLPLGYEAAASTRSQSEVLIIDVFKLREPEGPPQVEFTCTDPQQRVRWAGKNKLIIEGQAASSLSMRSELELSLDGQRVTVVLGGLDGPLASAIRLRDALPSGFTALIELPTSAGGEVSVTILRRRAPPL